MVKKSWVRQTIFTGLVALLPLGLLVIILIWLFQIAQNIVAPIMNLFGTPTLLTGLISVGVLLFFVFLFGLLVRTKLGQWFMNSTEKYILNYLPGYKGIKTVLEPFVGSTYKKSFKSVALVQIYENDVLATGFVTDKHEGYTTVFIPTGPNPTNGLIYHFKDKYVHYVDIPVSKALNTVITVGKGSSKLLAAHETKNKEKKTKK